ncbi:uncharacterized protein LOC119672935 [Teleopsis dalmanni]|uniref:uncharacterized protein LOC119672935 n=1 Tax=Teleopsis dalmanni TaxID=139649 RepID=UPI0018CEEBE5|nr:uncharacterized protein LOC119672935 [Teleopsis dalmanni]
MEEEEKKKYTLESLYYLYCNSVVKYSMEVDNTVYDKILLSQIDSWLAQAKLLRTYFTLTETGMIYMKFKRWRIDYEEFLEFLQFLCEKTTKITIDDVKKLLLEAGIPEGRSEIVYVK